MSDRALSFWGWGYEDRFPDDDARRALIRMAGAVLSHGAFALRPLPRLADLSLPSPRVAVPDDLAPIAAADVRARASHTYGKAFPDLVRGLHGDFAAAPDFVVTPRDEADIDRVLSWCSARRIACVPFGGGTSVVGGVEGGAARDAFAGVVSLDTRALDGVLDIDGVSRAARVQAGATGPRIAGQLAARGFALRHFPQSFEFSTLGGWIATRAGGHFATLYTHIDDLVEATRVVTPRGVVESRRLPGSGAGPSPDRLMLGSEGIFGVITEAWVRVHVRPRWRSQASVKFRDFWAAVAATRDIAQSGLHPANCRLLDSREAMLHQVTGDGAHVLLLGFESPDHPVSTAMARAVEIAAARGGIASEPVETDAGPPDTSPGADASASVRGAITGRDPDAAAWRSAFLDAPYRYAALASVGAVVDTFETACTWDRFEALHRRVIADVRAAMAEACGGGFVSCRFTHVYPDGPAPYYTFIAPGRAGAELEQWRAIKRAASDAVIASGGTITHHHAVGRTHRPWYEQQRPALYGDVLAAVKRTLDPAGVLNPGVLIDAGGG